MSSIQAYNNRINKTKAKIALYGKISFKSVAYCSLHKCYLEPIHIAEKKCNFKKCKYLCEI